MGEEVKEELMGDDEEEEGDSIIFIPYIGDGFNLVQWCATKGDRPKFTHTELNLRIFCQVIERNHLNAL